MILRELDNEMRPHGLPLRVNCYLSFDDWQFAALEQERGNGAFFHYTGYKGNELRQKELNLDQTIRSKRAHRRREVISRRKSRRKYGKISRVITVVSRKPVTRRQECLSETSNTRNK